MLCLILTGVYFFITRVYVSCFTRNVEKAHVYTFDVKCVAGKSNVLQGCQMCCRGVKCLRFMFYEKCGESARACTLDDSCRGVCHEHKRLRLMFSQEVSY